MTSKPLRADARRNRERVLHAAQEAFAADGLAVPLDDIARRAGVGAGTVYRHFATKEALFEAVIAHRVGQFVHEARTLADAPDPGAAFFGFFARTVEYAQLNKAICDALEAGFGGEPAARPDYAEEFGSALGALLDRAQRAGAVRTDIDADDLRALLAGCLTMQRLAADRDPGRLTRIMYDGLRAAPER